ncbi:MAG TPA: CBS domain-containing protein [Candidatus Paceibacterota bacterium]
MNKKLENSSFLINSLATIQDAMGAITDNQRGAVVIVDEKGHLYGLISDGDIRRAMLGGATLQTPVEKICNMRPLTITEGDAQAGKGKRIFDEEASITVIPVVGAGNTVADVLVRDPEKRKEF